MTTQFEEIDFQETPLGDISLRRRTDPLLGGKLLFEIKLGDEFLMSSLFTEAEIQLAKLGLAALDEDHWDIVVGGLGLGYTAAAVLDDPSVRSLSVIEIMKPIIDWHRQGLVPLGSRLTADSRCHLVQADFFQWVSSSGGFDQIDPSRLIHALLLDIDHSPTVWLHPENRMFYTTAGIRSMAEKLLPGGVFGLWSNDPPDDEFVQLLRTVFQFCDANIVSFPNPYLGGESTNTVYIARKHR